MPPAFLFDLDGTLVDRSRSLSEYLPIQYARYAVTQRESHEDYVKRFLELDRNGYGDKSLLFESLCREFEFWVEPHELLNDFRENCYRRAFLFPGVDEVLRELSLREHPLALVSNGSAQTQNTKIESTGIRSYFSSVIVSGEVGLRKPDRAIFELAAATLRIPVGDCIFVGDSPTNDIAGASRVGMRTVWISSGFDWPDSCRPLPTYVIDSVAALFADEQGEGIWRETV